jgi:hypothetical protein
VLPFAISFFFFPWLPETLLTVRDLAAGSVGGFRKHQVTKEIEGETDRDVYECVICICVGPVENKTVKLMYPGLPPEQTKQYLHGDFVLSPISLLLLFYPAIN